VLSSLIQRVKHRAQRYRYRPAIKVCKTSGLIRLGTHYGGWTLLPSSELERSTIISFGLGEDASFDVEFANRFNARVVIVDPTPRAIRHFERMSARLGQSKTKEYAGRNIGDQPVEAYDLSARRDGDFILEPSAVWVANTTLPFFAPPNPAHVSHSLDNYQQNYARDTAHLMVPTITPEDLLRKYSLEYVPLMKFDIEGAQNSVIPHMLKQEIFPRQILLEYDELNIPSERSKKKAETVHRALEAARYTCRHIEGSNYLYVRD
jgi:hypothetical protein